MNHNITHLYKLLLKKYTNKDKILSLFINYLSFYLKKRNLSEKDFFNRINLSLMKNAKTISKYNYNDYINTNFSNSTQNIILLNGFYHLSKNIKSDISVKIDNNKLNNNINYYKYNLDIEMFNIFYILNNIFSLNCIDIDIPSNVSYEEPLYILNFYSSISDNVAIYPSLHINVGRNSKIKIIESHINVSKNCFINAHVTLDLKSKSNVTYYLFNYSNTPLLDTYSLSSFQNSDSKLNFYKNSFGNQLYKGILNFYLHENDSYLNIKSANKLKNNSIYDLECNIFHYGNNSKSDTLFRSVNHDNSKCAFRGNLNVGLDINSINANLYSNSLLLSNKATVTFIPELNIDNDNVQCSHGATVGQLDDETMLYLMSRGLSKKECVSILITSFLSKSMDKNNMFFNILNKHIIKDY